MYVKPKEASKFYNVSENSLRVWANNCKIKYSTTKGCHRRYLLHNTNIIDPTCRQKIIYTRVSSSKQKNDLDRQSKYLTDKYPEHILITDVGSGINFERINQKIVEVDMVNYILIFCNYK